MPESLARSVRGFPGYRAPSVFADQMVIPVRVARGDTAAHLAGNPQHSVFNGHSTEGLAGLRACYGPLLLWGLTAAFYAFHTLAHAAFALTETVDSIRASEQMKGLRRLATIKQRLRHSTPPSPR